MARVQEGGEDAQGELLQSAHIAGERVLSARGLKVNKSDMLLTFENGSVIIFAGLDDVEKLKSIYGITGIWVEEASEITGTISTSST